MALRQCKTQVGLASTSGRAATLAGLGQVVLPLRRAGHGLATGPAQRTRSVFTVRASPYPGPQDPFESSFFADTAPLLRRMDQEMMEQQRQMDAATDRLFERSRALREQAMRDSNSPSYTYRAEEKGNGYYRYESVTVLNGGNYAQPAPQQVGGQASMVLLFCAAVIAGVFAAFTRRFHANYDITTYGQRNKWALILLWPVLLIFNPSFREQFTNAMRGHRMDKTSDTMT